MIVMLAEYDGAIAGTGDDAKKLLKEFYEFQPNDDTDVYLYDVSLHQSARVCSQEIMAHGVEGYEINWQSAE